MKILDFNGNRLERACVQMDYKMHTISASNIMSKGRFFEIVAWEGIGENSADSPILYKSNSIREVMELIDEAESRSATNNADVLAFPLPMFDSSFTAIPIPMIDFIGDPKKVTAEAWELYDSMSSNIFWCLQKHRIDVVELKSISLEPHTNGLIRFELIDLDIESDDTMELIQTALNSGRYFKDGVGKCEVRHGRGWLPSIVITLFEPHGRTGETPDLGASPNNIKALFSKKATQKYNARQLNTRKHNLNNISRLMLPGIDSENEDPT